MYILVLSKELASCHPSGAQNFEVAPRFLVNLLTGACGTADWKSVFFTNGTFSVIVTATER